MDDEVAYVCAVFDDVVMYRGKRIEEMTREELIEALKVAGNLYRDSLRSHGQTIDLWQKCQRSRP